MDEEKKKKQREKLKQEKLEKFKLKQEKLQNQIKNQENKNKEKVKEKKEKTNLIYDKVIKDGEKKDTSGVMPNAYDPKYVELHWYRWWQKCGFFKPEINVSQDIEKEIETKGKFVMVIPPPNVTGNLHLGHALTSSIQDSIIRWNRMNGKITLWVPGSDHAGIATQVVVEKKLKQQNISRHDLGRKKFLEEVWKWKNEKSDKIYSQLGLMGCSVDWDRERFTMDPLMSKSVVEAFVRLHEMGLIYRSNRLVNWSCSLRSAISDIEVEKKELTKRTFLPVPNYDQKIEFGVLFYFSYPVCDSYEKITVSTTRIETMLGDVAIAVHPKDERYKHLHGKNVLHPFCDRKMPIIVDDFVDIKFGTGAVKITPAHDPADYEVGVRHNLPMINILDDNGHICSGFGQFSNMKRFDARKAIITALKEKNFYVDCKNNPMIVPICSRSKDIVEPVLRYQWFVNCQDMAKKALNAVKNGDLELIPDLYCQKWYHWLENIRDWCISRQLWWGHQIPAYQVFFKDEQKKSCFNKEEYWVSGRNEEEALVKAAKELNIPADQLILKQDEDVLDTWFSSALFPFALFGWPNQTKDFKCFYPGELLETGHDILFFWVARMVMMGFTLTNQLPFKKVYLHSIVRDAHGRKMSKSLGNVIDPINVINGISLQGLHQILQNSNLDSKEIEKAKQGQKVDYPHGIPECGADALRFALCACITKGRDINLDIKRIEGYRLFCNKLWNAVKFTLNTLGQDFIPQPTFTLTEKTNKIDRWLLSRLFFASESCNKGFEEYDFQKITTCCYNLWRYEICDFYLESLKPINIGSNQEAKALSKQVLYTAIDIALRLIHPFMPFLTEELYQRLPRRPQDNVESICIAKYPNSNEFKWNKDAILEKEINFIQRLIHNVMSIRSEYNLGKKQVPLYIKHDLSSSISGFHTYLSTIKFLTNSSTVEILEKELEIPMGCAIVPVSDTCEVYLMLKGALDIDKEIKRLEVKKEKAEAAVNKLKLTIELPGYKNRVPVEVQTNDLEKLEKLEVEIKKIKEAIQAISLIGK